MTKNKLAIIGGSGLYDIEGLENPKWKSLSTPWGKPSDKILNFNYKDKEVCFSFPELSLKPHSPPQENKKPRCSYDAFAHP